MQADMLLKEKQEKAGRAVMVCWSVYDAPGVLQQNTNYPLQVVVIDDKCPVKFIKDTATLYNNWAATDEGKAVIEAVKEQDPNNIQLYTPHKKARTGDYDINAMGSFAMDVAVEEESTENVSLALF